MTHDELALFLSVADAIGSVGILLVVLWSFYTGRIIPASLVDILCQQASQRAIQTFLREAESWSDQSPYPTPGIHPTRPRPGDQTPETGGEG